MLPLSCYCFQLCPRTSQYGLASSIFRVRGPAALLSRGGWEGDPQDPGRGASSWREPRCAPACQGARSQPRSLQTGTRLGGTGTQISGVSQRPKEPPRAAAEVRMPVRLYKRRTPSAAAFPGAPPFALAAVHSPGVPQTAAAEPGAAGSRDPLGTWVRRGRRLLRGAPCALCSGKLQPRAAAGPGTRGETHPSAAGPFAEKLQPSPGQATSGAPRGAGGAAA